MELKLGATYQHYRTRGLYQAMALVKNTGDGQNDAWMVLYYSFSNGSLFVRPLTEFIADISDPRSLYRGPRFKLVGT